jgi:hypothetical protein
MARQWHDDGTTMRTPVRTSATFSEIEAAQECAHGVIEDLLGASPHNGRETALVSE